MSVLSVWLVGRFRGWFLEDIFGGSKKRRFGGCRKTVVIS